MSTRVGPPVLDQDFAIDQAPSRQSRPWPVCTRLPSGRTEASNGAAGNQIRRGRPAFRFQCCRSNRPCRVALAPPSVAMWEDVMRLPFIVHAPGLHARGPRAPTHQLHHVAVLCIGSQRYIDSGSLELRGRGKPAGRKRCISGYVRREHRSAPFGQYRSRSDRCNARPSSGNSVARRLRVPPSKSCRYAQERDPARRCSVPNSLLTIKEWRLANAAISRRKPLEQVSTACAAKFTVTRGWPFQRL